MKKALILAAHADDETLGCGGTLQVLIKEGWETEAIPRMSDRNIEKIGFFAKIFGIH